MLAQGLRDRTIEERLRVARQFRYEAEVELVDATYDDVSNWLAGKPAAGTRWTYFTDLKALFKWMVLTGRVEKDPLFGLPAPKKPRSRPRPVATVYIERVLNSNLHKRTRWMILLAYYLGLRVTEISKVRGQDYDRITGQLLVEGKGGQLAVLPINPDLQKEFEATPQRGWWFPSYTKNGHIRSRSVGDTISAVFARHGVKMTAHQLRHSFGTDLVASGVDIRVAQELMRHQSIQSTAIYVDVNIQQQLEAASRLPIFKEKP